ncbi:diguanylate cyclase [Rehaibacterium terrae]|uniref:diguanylate cyclase n=1 Tax=Rehaibacterium terrae TaxID=1341696 RepID=A0A7W7XZ77_9GAMM|nr:diguanylate cyclase (GGDEF)-like protein [Rehaibacterium terrae]
MSGGEAGATRLTASLAARARRGLLLIGLLAVLLSGVHLLWTHYQLRLAAMAGTLAMVAELSAEHVDDTLQHHLAAVAVLGALAPVESDWPRYLGEVRTRFPAFVTMLVADARGDVLASVPALPAGSRQNVADRAYFSEPMRHGRPYVSDVFRGRGHGNEPIVAVSAPLFDAEGRMAGVVEGSMLSDDVVRIRTGLMARGDLALLLLDGAGQVVHASAGLPFAPLDRLPPDRLRTVLEQADGRTLHRLAGLYADGASGLLVATVTPLGWRIAVIVPEARLRGELLLDLFKLLLPALLAVVAVWWVSARVARRFVDPLREVIARLRLFAFHADPQPIRLAGAPRELAELAEAFNHLIDRLGRAFRDVNQALAVQKRLREQLERVVAEREQEIARRTEELRLAVDALREDSLTDALTGVGNYRGYRLALDRLWAQALERGMPLAALVIDIDYFKFYNDSLGHPEGDQCLRAVAAILRDLARRERAELGRSGGEEFVLLLPDRDSAAAARVAEQVRRAVETAAMPHPDSPSGRVTVSVGYASRGPGDERGAEALIAAADQALYRAKREGRNRIAGAA